MAAHEMGGMGHVPWRYVDEFDERHDATLLELPSGSLTNWMFGDVHSLVITMTKADRAAGAFDPAKLQGEQLGSGADVGGGYWYEPDTLLARLARLAACNRMRARLLFDVIVWSRKEAASASAIRALPLAATSMPLEERDRGPMAKRRSRAMASRRLRIEALESAASLARHSIKPGRTSPSLWMSDWVDIMSPIGGANSKPIPQMTSSLVQSPSAGCLDMVNSS